MNLSELRFEIKRINEKKTELLKEKEILQSNLYIENPTKIQMLQEINNKLTIVSERLDKALKKEKELEYRVKEIDFELEI